MSNRIHIRLDVDQTEGSINTRIRKPNRGGRGTRLAVDNSFNDDRFEKQHSRTHRNSEYAFEPLAIAEDYDYYDYSEDE